MVKSQRRKRRKIESKRNAAAEKKKAPSEECWVAESSHCKSEDGRKEQVYYDPTYDYMEIENTLSDVVVVENPECK